MTVGLLDRFRLRPESVLEYQFVRIEPTETTFGAGTITRVGMRPCGTQHFRLRYSERIRRICGLPIKPLRLGALAAVSRRCATDRASLHLLFGVSIGTIEDVERLMEWDLHRTVDPEVVAHGNRIIRGEA